MRTLAVGLVLLGSSVASADSPPTVGFGEPTVKGGLAATVVTPAVKAAQDKLLTCYTTALAKDSSLSGLATVKFTVTTNGKATKTATTGLNAEVQACITTTFSKLVFKKTSLPTDVSFPVFFSNGAYASITAPGEEDVAGGKVDGFGGGGIGLGTIGTGTYGTIGHGSGTGFGVPARPSSLSIGNPIATGDLDKAIIRRYFKRNTARLTYCYEKEQAARPALAGTVDATFTIKADGAVSDVKATGVDAKVASCIVGVVKAMEFPKPKDGGVVQVKYPLTFQPPPKPAKKK